MSAGIATNKVREQKSSTILDTVGNTPMVELSGYSASPGVKILAKLEGANPGGSIKDRIAVYMVNDARERKLLRPGRKIIEATSGNTGIGLAMISAVHGYDFIAVMPESVSLERRKLLAAFGAEIILTDGSKGTNFAVETARNLVNESPGQYVALDQFSNWANVRAHYETTGAEIVRDTPAVTHFVAGMGTGGTLMGVGKRLREHNRDIQIVGVEPSPGSKVQGLRNMADFVPRIYRESNLDSKLDLADDNMAFELVRDLSANAGISVGMSSGAALWGAIEVSKRLTEGVIVTVFPDRGDRYVSTTLFSNG